MENHTAKHFVLQLGSLASLYLSLAFLLVLTFGLINILVPDATDSVWQIEGASQMVRIGIAMVIVFFPTYLILTRIVNQTRRRNTDGSYLGLTKWLIYLSLLVGGAVLLGDLVAVVMAFLEGEITERFILKAGAVLIVVGAAFYYYLLDARGHWIANEKKSIIYGTVAAVVVALIVLTGFIQAGSPAEVREVKLDETQLDDLREIQWRIQDHLTVNAALPATLDELEGAALPEAPEDRPAYQYELTENGFQLCATFAEASRGDQRYYGRPYIPETESIVIVNPDNWQHDAGAVCFARVVNVPQE